jgi:chorismate synthase
VANNSFGKHFRITTWGESHGKAIGVVVDGCPARLELSEADINEELKRRAPGANAWVSPRKEEDRAEILSGLFEGETTGAPISIIIPNTNQDSSKYEPIKELYRPGHANYTYLKKYGIFDYRGGGRASARETACRVAAGAIAKKLLATQNIHVVAYLKGVGDMSVDMDMSVDLSDLPSVLKARNSSPLFCPDVLTENEIIRRVDRAKSEGDSLGGVVECITAGLPVGLGDPVYEKIEANLAKAMMSLPASKGVEFGCGFAAAAMRGSEHNDAFGVNGLLSNRSGGILGGITTGELLSLRVAFKPTSSIKKQQQTTDLQGNIREFTLPKGSRHDPCVAIRAVVVVEAMAALVLADAFLAAQLQPILQNACASYATSVPSL